MSLTIVASIRAKYPTPLGAEHPTFLLEVARALRLGLVIKNQGTRITLPDGTTVSQDVVMNAAGTAWDILADGEGAATPVFNAIEPIDPTRYYPVQAQAMPAPEVPQEPPQEPPPVTADYSKEFAELQDTLRSIVSVLELVEARLTQVENKNLTCVPDLTPIHTSLNRLELIARNTFYKSKLFGVGFTLNPDVRA